MLRRAKMKLRHEYRVRGVYIVSSSPLVDPPLVRVLEQECLTMRLLLRPPVGRAALQGSLNLTLKLNFVLKNPIGATH